mgnify:CR=1 FL=1
MGYCCSVYRPRLHLVIVVIHEKTRKNLRNEETSVNFRNLRRKHADMSPPYMSHCENHDITFVRVSVFLMPTNFLLRISSNIPRHKGSNDIVIIKAQKFSLKILSMLVMNRVMRSSPVDTEGKSSMST